MLKNALRRLWTGGLGSALTPPDAAACMPHGRLRELVRKGQDFDIMLVNAREFPLLCELFGPDLSQEIGEQLLGVLKSAATERIHVAPISLTMEPGEYMLCWPSLYKDPRSLHDIAYEIKLIAQREANAHLMRWAGRELDLGIGCARLEGGGDGAGRETRLFMAVGEARLRAKMRLDMSHLSLSTEFSAILEHKNIQTVFQPIADFSSGSILAWEALARGPADSIFQSPTVLFDFAEQSGKLFALESLCREKALHALGEVLPGQKIFLNVHPKILADPKFARGTTFDLLQELGLAPENVVFEITECHNLNEFALFHRTLDHYRSQGFLVAMYVSGVGYSGLTSAAQTQPEYIKINKSLIQGVDRDPVKRALIETMVAFADKIGSVIVTEGIESQAQATCLIDIGVHCGQGDFLARSDMPKPCTCVNLTHLRKPLEQSRAAMSCLLPVGNIVEAAHMGLQDMIIPDAQHAFEKGCQQASLVVVDADQGAPVGLVMEYQLNRQLSNRFGAALYSKRTIEALMDRQPLVVDESTTVEHTAKLAMQRDKMKAYDDIIVTKQGKVLGIVTVLQLLNALADVQVEMAKGTNPLTGLPGNVNLEREVEASIGAGQSFSIAYADLDNFKVYNDTYGFTNGDRVIKLAAEVMNHAVRRHGDPLAKLFHVGGDDFIFMTQPEHVERVCLASTRCFKRLIRACYSPEDRARGRVWAAGRDGVERAYPLVSLSIGILEINGPCTLMEIGERAAYVKKFAKSIPGNVYTRDRRPPLGLAHAPENGSAVCAE